MHETNDWGITVDNAVDFSTPEPEKPVQFVEANKKQSLEELMKSMK